MRIAFISNYDKTIFFHAVAKALELKKYEIFWISPSHRWAEWLIEQGVALDKILDVTLYGSEWANNCRPSEQKLARLVELEKSSGININNLILMDRLLSERPYYYALNYLSICLEHIHEFLIKNQIELVFSEQTWALEILVDRICLKLGIPSWVPRSIRIPDGRFTFFKGYLESEIADIRAVTDEDIEKVKGFYVEYLKNKPKPRYYYLNNRVTKPELKWISKLLKNIKCLKENPFDESHPSPQWLVKLRVKEAINAFTISTLKPFFIPTLPADRPFVLFTLHKQPESSIDVLGAYFSNQIELVKTLARSLPVTHDLYVKEHSNAIGDRSIIDYNAFKQIPGVRLVDPFADTFALIAEADLVVSVSGTVLYEAALLGRPAISIAPMFFGPLLTANGINPYQTSLIEILDKIYTPSMQPNSDEKCLQFLAWLIAQSFPGIINGSASDSRCMEEKNINLVTAGFLALIDKQQRKVASNSSTTDCSV